MAFLTVSALISTASVSESWAQRVPCTSVLRELHQVERRGALRGGDAGRVAKSLGTTTAWVEKCAGIYGRRLNVEPGARSQRESQEHLWESEEFEEIAREDRETEGDVVVDPAPYRDKARQRGFSLSLNEDPVEDPERLWSPYEHQPWSPNTGRQWSPYRLDPHRTVPDEVPGMQRQ